MTINYTTNLALAQPVTGTESGTWGDDVNNGLTAYLDIAISGGLAVTVTSSDVTLTNTQGTNSATNIGSTTAQYAILNVSGTMTGAKNLIVPSSSKWYIVNNSTTGGYTLTVKGSSTTGVGLVNNERALIAWNGTDYYKIASTIFTNTLLTNPTITGYVESVVSIGTVSTSNTLSLTNGTVQTATLTASTACTFTMPTATAGKSFVLLLKQAASTGGGSATFSGVKWALIGAPTITATPGKMDILTFISDGTNWYGSYIQGYTP